MAVILSDDIDLLTSITRSERYTLAAAQNSKAGIMNERHGTRLARTLSTG